MYGKLKSIHIGSYHKKGLYHKNKILSDMTNDELCDEFRFKLSKQVSDGKTRFFSDSYMKKRRKRKDEDLRLKKQVRKEMKEQKFDVIKKDIGIKN